MDLSNAILDKLSIHYVGNKTQDEEIILSKKSVPLDDELNIRLRDFFLKKFADVQERYHFTNAAGLKYNEIYNFATELFNGETPFHRTSVNIARHLYEQSTHPKVKPGELYVCLFKDCMLEGEVADVIGIFKTESKTGYFNIEPSETFNVKYAEGVEATKFDKGCIIFNEKKKDGYIICALDNQNRGEDALYWKEHFLGLVPVNNEYHQTNQFLDITKQFVTRQLNTEWDITKADQINLLNKSIAYFKNNESFDKSDFENKVLEGKDIIKSFRKFDETYRNEFDVDLPDTFGINAQAVKKQNRIYKSVLKLDKNFHVYIHGRQDMIERGIDADGRKYYKLYYESES